MCADAKLMVDVTMEVHTSRAQDTLCLETWLTTPFGPWSVGKGQINFIKALCMSPADCISNRAT